MAASRSNVTAAARAEPDQPAIAVPAWSKVMRWSVDAVGGRNMLLLVQLRWLAVLGQLLTITFVHFAFGMRLPLVPLVEVLAILVALNIATTAVMRRRNPTAIEMVLALLVDFAALSAQLYYTGGATNPFVFLFLLQVVLAAVLLEGWASWMLVALTSGAFAVLAIFHRPLMLPARFAGTLSPLQLTGAWLTFVLTAVLLVLFVTRINRNLSARDAHLAEMRQHAVEEDHIVRMGLLASGAAHELGTPLASLAVILGDWQRMPALTADAHLAEEIADMQAAVARCKGIVTGILFAAGEARGEGPMRTTLHDFLSDIAANWDAIHPGVLRFQDMLGKNSAIVSDQTLAQVIGNLLDNAFDAGANAITLSAARRGSTLVLAVEDDGRGFAPTMLGAIGKPYATTKDQGGGLGLFLAVNVLRKFGGAVEAENRPAGGAIVTLTLPLAALALETSDD